MRARCCAQSSKDVKALLKVLPSFVNLEAMCMRGCDAAARPRGRLVWAARAHVRRCNFSDPEKIQCRRLLVLDLSHNRRVPCLGTMRGACVMPPCVRRIGSLKDLMKMANGCRSLQAGAGSRACFASFSLGCCYSGA